MTRASGQTPAGLARPGGFTIAELIVAVTLTALVSGSTVAIMRSTGAARRLVDSQMSRQQRARAGVSAVAAALSNASRLGGDETVLEGTDDWIGAMPADRIRLFVVRRGPVRLGQPESDVKECEFILSWPPGRGPDSGDDSPPMLMRRTDPTRNETPDGGGVVEVVADNVVSLDLAYHDGIEWLPDWPKERKGWPMAVRIRLAVLGDTGSRRSDASGRPKVWTISRIVNFPHPPAQMPVQDGQDSQ